MTDYSHYPLRLADDIARLTAELNEHLYRAAPDQSAEILGRALDAEDGILGKVTQLMITGSHFAKRQAEAGALPPEVCLALGRAANELHDISLDLDEHAGDLERLARPPDATSAPAVKPAACDMVARRRR
ncbi:hypothetical protein ACIBK8_25680 [Streptomyces sp. NPDC050161]|uniref:hypothetical protein n=1 Tax=Streptomyces sp. NPDC050161 TaxID=3365604 RepID=UPI0037954F0B